MLLPTMSKADVRRADLTATDVVPEFDAVLHGAHEM